MLTKKDLTNLIIKTHRPDHWRLSFDYFHPIPDRDWGQPTGTEKKWAHEGKFLTNWIESAKLSDKPRNKEQKEAKKKQREEKLVKGFNPTDVEAKVTKIFEAYTQDWRITAIVESKIDEVID